MKKIIALLSLVGLVGLAACTQTTTTITTTTTEKEFYEVNEDDNIVYVEAGKDFKILQLADLHLSDGGTEPYANGDAASTYAFITQLVNKNKPDLIVLTGDNFFGYSPTKATELGYILDAFNIPWTLVWGNHDTHSQSLTEKQGYINILSAYKNFIFRNEYENASLGRNGDHLIQLREKGTNKLLYAFYLFDSGTHSQNLPDNKGVGYESIYEDQLNFYKNKMEALNARYAQQKNNKFEQVPHIVFQHMGVQEYNDAFNATASGKAILLFGKQLETPCPGLVNTGQFDLMKSLNAKGMFVGHDHVNTFGILYEGVLLGYGGQAGNSNSYYLNTEEPKNGVVITISGSDLKLNAEPDYLDKESTSVGQKPSGGNTGTNTPSDDSDIEFKIFDHGNIATVKLGSYSCYMGVNTKRHWTQEAAPWNFVANTRGNCDWWFGLSYNLLERWNRDFSVDKGVAGVLDKDGKLIYIAIVNADHNYVAEIKDGQLIKSTLDHTDVMKDINERVPEDGLLIFANDFGQTLHPDWPNIPNEAYNAIKDWTYEDFISNVIFNYNQE